MQRRVRHVDAAAMQQPLDLRQPHVIREQLLDRVALGLALLPAIAVRSPRVRRQRGDDCGHLLVIERRIGAGRESATLRRDDVAAHGLHVERQLRRDPLLLDAGRQSRSTSLIQPS
jgi:hypothetical protein